MPQTEVIFFKDEDESVPALEWLDDQLAKVQDKMLVRIEQLEKMGHELRRPASAPLRDKIYELRASHLHVNYRILYFFHDQMAILSHGLTKEAEVPDGEINQAIKNMKKYISNPKKYTFEDNDEE